MEEKEGKDKVIKLIKLTGEVIEEKTLKNLQEQLGTEEFDTLILEIASPGGSVAEGLAIMVWLDQLSLQGKEIISVVVANAYSIASLIMLAADYRIISKHGKVMVHNPMVPELSYANADELEKYASELRQLESVMYELYQIFTGLSKEEIKVLMDNETYLTPAEAVKNGFADVVVDIKPKSFEMTSINNKKINMTKTLNILNKVISLVSKADFVNQLYRDNEGGEIEIFQNDPATFAIGDRTNVENADEIVLANGAKLKIEDFVITEINRDTEVIEETKVDGDEAIVEEEVKAEGDEVVAPAIEEVIEEKPTKGKGEMPSKVIEITESVKTTKETVAAKISEILKFEFEVTTETFEVGDKVEYVPFNEGDDPISVGSGEYLLPDGRKILVDSDGIIQMIKPVPGVEVTEEEIQAKATLDKEAKATDEEIKAKAKEEDDVKAKATEHNDDDKKDAKAAKHEDDDKKDAKAGEFNEGTSPKKDEDAILKALTEMKAQMTNLEEEVKAIKDDSEAKFKALDKFETKAAKAIETLAENTVSHFKPAARAMGEEAKVIVKSTGSIFQNLKAKVQASKKN
ncbi:MAG: Clp protease ClpP [Nitrosopumilus sp.]